MADEDEEETLEMATRDPHSEENKETLTVEELPSFPEESQENLTTEELPQNPVESRENLVHTAVSFLQNPKVRDGPVAHKKSFLRKKGLTEDEISDAFMRSGTVEHVPQPMVPYQLPQPPPIVQIPVVSSWMRIRETMVAGLLVWGVSKAAHRFYTEYVSPYFDIKWPQERRLEVIENSVLEMQNNLVETMTKVQEVVGTVQHQQKQMLVLTEQLLKNMPPSSSSIASHQNDQTANEIKSELNSIKGILLSRKQFPTVPNIGTSLPTWQLNTSPPAGATPQTLEPETKASKIPNNELDILPPPSNQTSADAVEKSNSETVISIEDNKEVDNPNYIFVNGESSEQQKADNKHSSKKSRTKKEDTKKKNNNNVNDFSTEENNKLDKSHVI